METTEFIKKEQKKMSKEKCLRDVGYEKKKTDVDKMLKDVGYKKQENDPVKKAAEMMIEDKEKGHTINVCGATVPDKLTKEQAEKIIKEEDKKESEEKLEFYYHGDLKNKEFPELKWIIKNQIPEGEVGIMAGKRGERKTFFALYQAICAASGIDCIEDEVTKKHRVLYVSEEDSMAALNPRIQGMIKGLKLEEENLEIMYFTQNNLKLDNGDEKFEEFEEILNEFKPSLVVIDTLQRCVSFDVDIDNKSISEFFTGIIRPLQKKYGGSWLFIHHLRKEQMGGGKSVDDLMDKIRGGSEIVNYPRFVLICQVPKQSKDMMVLTPVKMSYAELSEPKVVSFENNEESGEIKVNYAGIPAEVLSKEVKCAEAIKEWLFDNQITEFKTMEIKEAKDLEFGDTIKQNALKLLIGQGFLERKKLGFYQVSGGVNKRLIS